MQKPSYLLPMHPKFLGQNLRFLNVIFTRVLFA